MLDETGERKLNILHIAGWYPTEKNPTRGVFVREHIKATALYNDVAVIYSEGAKREIRGFYQFCDKIEDGIRTLQLRYKKSFILKSSRYVN